MLIKIVFRHTKGYLVEKDAYVFLCYTTLTTHSACVAIANEHVRKEFGISDVPNESCLLLCSHISVPALLFADQAFAAPSLTSPEQLFRLWIVPGQKQLPVPLKEEIVTLTTTPNNLIYLGPDSARKAARD